MARNFQISCFFCFFVFFSDFFFPSFCLNISKTVIRHTLGYRFSRSECMDPNVVRQYGAVQGVCIASSFFSVTEPLQFVGSHFCTWNEQTNKKTDSLPIDSSLYSYGARAGGECGREGNAGKFKAKLNLSLCPARVKIILCFSFVLLHGFIV